jgi:hypothetical protein
MRLAKFSVFACETRQRRTERAGSHQPGSSLANAHRISFASNSEFLNKAERIVDQPARWRLGPERNAELRISFHPVNPSFGIKAKIETHFCAHGTGPKIGTLHLNHYYYNRQSIFFCYCDPFVLSRTRLQKEVIVYGHSVVSLSLPRTPIESGRC